MATDTKSSTNIKNTSANSQLEQTLPLNSDMNSTNNSNNIQNNSTNTSQDDQLLHSQQNTNTNTHSNDDINPLLLNKDELWKSLVGELEITANPAYVKTHIPGAYIKDINTEDKIIEITAPSEFQRNFIEDRLYGHIREIINKLVSPDYKLMFTVTKKDPTKISTKDLGPLFEQPESFNLTQRVQQAGLNPQYTFKRLVVGDHNRLAYAVATAIADAPGQVYNPFFLYSGVGLGKTHLVQAIGHQILEKHPDKKVLYNTGEQFLNDVIESLRRGIKSSGIKRNDFKRKYRNVDVLIIDDVHAIAGKATTQEEFFHTFNALFMAQKQIILTSDRAPHEIKTLEERLSSRFASGMIADIQKPDLETRIAILRERNEEMNLGAPDDVLEYIATLVDTNIRELEAKLLQTVTKAKSLGLDLNARNTADILGDIKKTQKTKITPNTIIKETAKYYGVTIKDIKGKSRLKTLVRPRQVCMFLLRDYANMGYKSIGELLGGRDHTTIMHGVDKISTLYNESPQFRKEIDQIKNNIEYSENG